MRRLTDEAIVLGRRELGESDRVVCLLGRRLGRLDAVAPAGRRSLKRFGGCLDLFVKIEVVLVDRGRGLPRLEEAVLREAHSGISLDLVAIAHAGYAVELVSALLREGEEAGAVFELLAQTLGDLTRGPLPAAGLRGLELRLLGLAGLAPALGACRVCDRREADRWVFDPERGGVVCGSCPAPPGRVHLGAEALDLLRKLQAGTESPQVSAGAMHEARELLAILIDQHAGRPLPARKFLRSLAADAGGRSVPNGPDSN